MILTPRVQYLKCLWLPSPVLKGLVPPFSLPSPAQKRVFRSCQMKPWWEPTQTAVIRLTSWKLQDLHTSSSSSSPVPQSVPASLLCFCVSVSHWGTTLGCNMAMTSAFCGSMLVLCFILKKRFRLLPQIRDSLLGYDCHDKLWSMQRARRPRAQQILNCTWLLTLHWEESITACWGMMDRSKLWSAEWSGGLELKAEDLLVWHLKNDERSLPEKQLSARPVPGLISIRGLYLSMLMCCSARCSGYISQVTFLIYLKNVNTARVFCRRAAWSDCQMENSLESSACLQSNRLRNAAEAGAVWHK